MTADFNPHIKRLNKKTASLENDIKKLKTLDVFQDIDVVKKVATLPAASSDLNGYRFFQDSDKLEYYCDGTKWLSTQLFEVEIKQTGTYAQPFTFTSNASFGQGSVHGSLLGAIPSSSFVFVGMEITCSTAATYDATHYWQPNVFITNSAGATTEIFGVILRDATHNTAGQIYHFGAPGVNTVYNTSTAALVGLVYRNNVSPSISAGTLTVYKQSVFIRIVG
ncbi:MAG: hypothetical protein J0I20_33965 [Chloroflexi bacterium]|nr:hypothetical protein [Chloroflexota bacterium]OJW05599.1 MAG: hypothetical protein BGO39_03000 [Chloroflexi bacterium 54-19]